MKINDSRGDIADISVKKGALHCKDARPLSGRELLEAKCHPCEDEKRREEDQEIGQAFAVLYISESKTLEHCSVRLSWRSFKDGVVVTELVHHQSSP